MFPENGVRKNGKRIILALVIVIFLAALTASAYFFLPRNTTTTATPCQDTYQNASFPSVPVLIMGSGSSGEICVRYTNPYGNNGSSRVYAAPYSPSGQNGFLEVSDGSISITPSPSSLTFASNDRNGSQIVVYRVTVAANVSNGIHGLLLFGFCDLQPLVVGTSQYGLNRGEFPWYPHFGSCPAGILQAQIIGVTGIKVVYV